MREYYSTVLKNKSQQDISKAIQLSYQILLTVTFLNETVGMSLYLQKLLTQGTFVTPSTVI